MKPIRALCPMCNSLVSGALNAELVPVCAYCAGEGTAMARLYTEIVQQRPWLKDKSPSEVFRALWEAWKKLQ